MRSICDLVDRLLMLSLGVIEFELGSELNSSRWSMCLTWWGDRLGSWSSSSSSVLLLLWVWMLWMKLRYETG